MPGWFLSGISSCGSSPVLPKQTGSRARKLHLPQHGGIMKSLAPCIAITAASVLLGACGSSPTEPANTSGPRTTLNITVTKCDLGGSVVVTADGFGNTPATLLTPGAVTLSLTPGPHTLTFQRGNQVFAANILGLGGAADALAAIPPGATAAITVVDPVGACLALPAH
jgi:hypothetical protein